MKLNNTYKQVVSNIEKPTPIWAKLLRKYVTAVYSILILLNESGVWEILGENALTIKILSVVAVILINVVLSNFVDKSKVKEYKDMDYSPPCEYPEEEYIHKPYNDE